MARDLNQWQGIGRLGDDPEVRQIPNGNTVANFNVACNDDYKSKSGEEVKQTEWVKIVVWGRLAEICGEWLHKGDQVYLSGKLTTRKWEDKDGVTRYTTEVNVRDMQMLGKAGGGERRGDGHSEPASKPASKPEEPFEDDIPF